VPWGPATTNVLYDKTAPTLKKKDIQLSGVYSGTNFTVTFTAAATDPKTEPSGIDKYLLVFNPAGSTKARCASGTSLPITFTGTRGTATVNIASAALVKKHKFRLCAVDKAGNIASGLTLTGKA
jgi:hypothetical protein